MEYPGPGIWAIFVNILRGQPVHWNRSGQSFLDSVPEILCFTVTNKRLSPTGQQVLSLDVVSLFTNLLISKTIMAFARTLKKTVSRNGFHQKNQNNYPLCLKISQFQFNDEIDRQKWQWGHLWDHRLMIYLGQK